MLVYLTYREALTYQEEVNADAADSPDPAVLGEDLDKLVHLEVETSNKTDNHQVIKDDVDKDNGSNNRVGQVKVKLEKNFNDVLFIHPKKVNLLTTCILVESKK